MGTNYYARIIPTKERKEELKKLIDTNNFDKIIDKINKTYGTFHAYDMNTEIKGSIHLGKMSCGWKFLWNPNIHIIRNGHLEKEEIEKGHTICRYIPEPDTAFHIYPLTKKGIKEFLDREDVEVYDEYGEKQNKEQFFEEALNWTTWKHPTTGEVKEAWDSKTYYEETKERLYKCDNELVRYLSEHDIKFISESRTDFYSDGLRFSTSIEFS